VSIKLSSLSRVIVLKLSNTLKAMSKLQSSHKQSLMSVM